MAITSRATIKSILNISIGDITKDAWIDALIPQMESDYVAIRNKPFDVGTKINFTSTTAIPADGELTITLGNYAAIGSVAGTEHNIVLRAGDTANVVARRVMNQIEPSSYYTVTAPLTGASSTSADVYLTERYEEWTENYSVLDVSVAIPPGSGLTASVSKMQTVYPDGAEFTAARMIQYHMNAGKSAGIQSEQLGDYSVTFVSESHYPRSITGGIKRYVKTL